MQFASDIYIIYAYIDEIYSSVSVFYINFAKIYCA
jgi:hypothetical protein